MLTGLVSALLLVACGGTVPSTSPGPATGSRSVPPGPSEVAATAATPSASALVSPPLAAPSVALTGSVTFMRDDPTGHPQVWVACADLTKARQLTNIPERSSGWPVWSPDGSRIAVDTDREDPTPTDSNVINDIFTMARDGSDVRKLTDSVGLSGDPAYSPDGKLIAFEADRGSQAKQGIYVMNSDDGGGLRRITTLPAGFAEDRAPRFSPDGKQLVFTRRRDDNRASLFLVNVDGSGLRETATASLNPGDAVWSPDGMTITFETGNPTFDRLLGPWVMDRDGKEARSLTGPQDLDVPWGGFADPVWSPDGKLIMMLRGNLRPGGEPINEGLATIGRDGSDLRFVTDGKGAEHQPDWHPSPC